jgi:hypothetical protein
MKFRITRYLLTTVGLVALAGTQALFAGDRHRDYRNLERQNADIRQDRRELHEDLEHGRYRRAAREREDLRHDYAERNRQRRDIHRDEWRDRRDEWRDQRDEWRDQRWR